MKVQVSISQIPFEGKRISGKKRDVMGYNPNLTKTAHLHKWSLSRLSKIDRMGDPDSVHTREGDETKSVSFEDRTGIYETVFFPKTYSRFCHMLKPFRSFLLKGTVQETFGALTLTVEEVAFPPAG